MVDAEQIEGWGNRSYRRKHKITAQANLRDSRSLAIMFGSHRGSRHKSVWRSGCFEAKSRTASSFDLKLERCFLHYELTSQNKKSRRRRLSGGHIWRNYILRGISVSFFFFFFSGAERQEKCFYFFPIRGCNYS